MHFVHLNRQFNDGIVFSLSFDGIVLVTQSHDTLPPELECLKAPLQDYGSVSLLFKLTHLKNILIFSQDLSLSLSQLD